MGSGRRCVSWGGYLRGGKNGEGKRLILSGLPVEEVPPVPVVLLVVLGLGLPLILSPSVEGFGWVVSAGVRVR